MPSAGRSLVTVCFDCILSICATLRSIWSCQISAVHQLAPGGNAVEHSKLTFFPSMRSFYPLFPPALGTPLDLNLAPGALELTSLPDVLVLPSDLAPFVKVSLKSVSCQSGSA